MNDEKTIADLFDHKPFMVPKYQRGYRWQKVNVIDLLSDLLEFLGNDRQSYSLQPLVVKENGVYWNVVDGQQRLTTIAILLNYLQPQGKHYQIKYESRPKQQLILTDDDSNIDQYHVNQTYQSIEKWFENHSDVKDKFLKMLYDKLPGKHIKFIWFETPDDEVRTFIRLNKDKISLTNAELIKALLLRKGNFDMESTLMQKNVAVEWNSIESTFQDDAFWYFLRPEDDNRPTRVDFIFEIIKDMQLLDFTPNEDVIGNDQYSTFRYFHEYFKDRKQDAFTLIWRKVEMIYNIFCHWFNEIELYHYIGYLVFYENKGKDVIHELLQFWMEPAKTIDSFKDEIKKRIKDVVTKCSDLNETYELKGCPQKVGCKPVLVLFNIETILVRNRNMEKISNTQIVHKFPFHLLKKEKWDVEHISSNTDNPLDNIKSQKEWLKTFLLDSQIGEDFKSRIKLFIEGNDSNNFETLRKDLNAAQAKEIDKTERLEDDEDKNQIWNFCLLDQSTNRSYGNSIFPVKRRVIIGKESGKKFILNDDLTEKVEDTTIAYVPVCTINAFLKAYTTRSTSPQEWTKEDAKAYKKAIYDCLKDFGITC